MRRSTADRSVESSEEPWHDTFLRLSDAMALLAGPPFLLSFAIALSVMDCSSLEPCYGLRPGSKLAITVVEPYDRNSHFKLTPAGDPVPGCGFGFDVSQAQVMDATVLDNEGTMDCKIAIVAIASFGNWTWTPDRQSGVDGAGLNFPVKGSFAAQNASCKGFSSLTFQVLSGDPFQASVPGQVPHVIMTRAFGSGFDAAMSCPACIGTFVVNLQRL